MLFSKEHSDIILDTDSEYSRIWVRNLEANNRKFYAVQVDLGLESITSEEEKLSSEYMKYYDLFEYYNNDSKDVLMIGGAAYIYPTYFLEKFQEKNIDVVEIDPKMTQIAQEYFDLDLSNSRIQVYHQDGRTYLNKSSKKYDCILLDAFKGINAPFQLTTYEAMMNAKNILNEDGVVITNIVASLEGENAKFLEYEYSTYKAVFDEVKIYKVQDGFKDDELQNIVLIGIKNNGNINENVYEEYKYLLGREITNFTSNKDIVTDDLCPIGV